MTALNDDVFINCPFDEPYRELFEAIVFTIRASGYNPVCALDDDDFGDVRLNKLTKLIERCDRSIHDLSRTEASANGFPRFNMPFELGVTIGAQKFGDPQQKRKRILCLVERQYDMPKFLSDAGGNDPKPHANDIKVVIKLVRNWLRTSPSGERLPGPTALAVVFDEFRKDLPDILKKAQLTEDEINPFGGNYHDFLSILAGWTEENTTA